MRYPRLKIRPEEGECCYHLMSRTVNGEHLFGEVEKEMLGKQISKVAEYCGIEVINCTPMINHFHITARVPKKQPVSDAELLRRYALLHSSVNRWETQAREAIERMLAEDGEDAAHWRERQLAMMGDISPFMQLVKQRFSIWYNRTHQRYGTLWAERYKSVLLEPRSPAVMMSAIYTDLNPVRAALVIDPKEYRYCSYAQAVAGDKRAQQGLASLFPGKTWEEAQPEYRILLFLRAAKPRSKGAVLPAEIAARVVAEGGEIPWGELLRCRARFLTDGAVLGSKAFVAEQLAAYRKRTGRGQRTKVRELPQHGGLAIMRNLRLPVAG